MKSTTKSALESLVENMLAVILIGFMACVVAVALGLFLRIVRAAAGF